MGRGKFGPPQQGPWTGIGTDEEWRGWWGSNPPFHTPVFVLTHHPRPAIEMEGGTVFHFVDASPHEALDLAHQAAGDLDVRIGGGPTTVRDFLAADLIDVLHVVQVAAEAVGVVRDHPLRHGPVQFGTEDPRLAVIDDDQQVRAGLRGRRRRRRGHPGPLQEMTHLHQLLLI